MYSTRSSYIILDNKGTRVESEVAVLFVFSQIRMMYYFRLGFSMVKSAPQVLETPEKLV